MTRFATQHVGNRSCERRGQRHRQRADGDNGRDAGGASAEFFRQQRQNRLWRVEIDEGAIAGNSGGESEGKGVSCFRGRHPRKPDRASLVQLCISSVLNVTRVLSLDCEGANCMAHSSEPKHAFGTQERFLGVPDASTFDHVDAAAIEFFLLPRNIRVCVGRVVAAVPDAGQTGLEACDQE